MIILIIITISGTDQLKQLCIIIMIILVIIISGTDQLKHTQLCIIIMIILVIIIQGQISSNNCAL